jgi:hypothetical protein
VIDSNDQNTDARKEYKMHRDHFTTDQFGGVSRGMRSKQFVAELHDNGLTQDQTIEAVCAVFGVPLSAARLFVSSHPAWEVEPGAEDRGHPTVFTRC